MTFRASRKKSKCVPSGNISAKNGHEPIYVELPWSIAGKDTLGFSPRVGNVITSSFFQTYLKTGGLIFSVFVILASQEHLIGKWQLPLKIPIKNNGVLRHKYYKNGKDQPSNSQICLKESP